MINRIIKKFKKIYLYIKKIITKYKKKIKNTKPPARDFP
jgi:hypothetical protein